MKNNSQKHTVCPAITMPETLNYLGYHRRKAPVSLCKTVSSMHALALKIAEPKRMISIQEVSVNDDKIFFNRYAFYSQNLSHLLKDSEKAALFLVTIGKHITQTMQKLLDNQNFAEAYILDKIASLLVERFAQETQEDIARTADSKNMQYTRRFSPGYGDWNVKEQKKIFNILKPEKIGVKLTRHCMMVPEKSISAIFGMRKEGEQ